MNAGRGEAEVAAGGPARHIPVLLAEALEALDVARRRPLSRRHLRRRRLFARAARARRARHRDRSRSRARSPAGQDARRGLAGRLTLVEGRFGDLDAIARRLGAAPLDGVVARHRRLLDAVRRGRARLLAAPRRAARHAHGRRRGAAPPTSCARTTSNDSPTFSFISARSAPRGASRAPSSPTARRRPMSRRCSSPR